VELFYPRLLGCSFRYAKWVVAFDNIAPARVRFAMSGRMISPGLLEAAA